ncbi:MAG: hypothetical protein AMXMBFR53_08990 [Gemmatimonadota bacterium]
MVRETVQRFDTRRPSRSELELTGELALLLEGGRRLDGLDAALLRLRRAVAANVCELFLTTPREREMVLVSHQGDDSDAFLQVGRFRIGEGFPGLVLDSGDVLSTQSLEGEGDFLRSRVKTLGYRGALCVPLGDGQDPLGCLLLAWKDLPADWRSCARSCLLAAEVIGGAVDGARVRTRAAGLEAISAIREVVEGELRALTCADEARFVMLDPAPEALPGPAAFEERCPACRSGSIQVLGGRAGWPRECIGSQCMSPARYCVPLKGGTGVWGVASVAFRRPAPVPLTRRLPALLWFAEGIAPPSPEGQGSGAAVGVNRHPGAGEARLRIHCIGGFEVWLEGKRLQASDFGRRKARELLAVLVSAAGAPRSAERLARELWPSAPATSLRNRFHVTVSALRRAVEPHHGRGTSWVHVRTDGDRYYLDRASSIWVDLWYPDHRQHAGGESPRDGLAAPTEVGSVASSLGRRMVFSQEFDAEWAAEADDRWRARWARTGSTPAVWRTLPSTPC